MKKFDVRRERMERIALCGFFDLPNCIDYGLVDLFSKAENSDGNYEIDVYGVKGLPGKVYPVTELEKRHLDNNYDAIVIMGEGLICSKNREDDYSSSMLYLIPAMLSDKYGIKMIINSAGVAMDSDVISGLFRSVADNSEYVSVNSYDAFLNAKDMGYDENHVKFVPDYMVLASDYYKKDDIKELKNKYITADEYVVVNYDKNLNEEMLDSLEENIKGIILVGGHVVLLPVYPSKNEAEAYKEFAKRFDDSVSLVDGNISMEELCAIVAGAMKLITQNMPLAAIAYSYGVQAYGYDFEGKIYNIDDDLFTPAKENVENIKKYISNEKKHKTSMINSIAGCFSNIDNGFRCKNLEDENNTIRGLMELYKAKAEDFENELHTTQANMKYFKASYENLLQKYDADIQEKNNAISKVNRKLYEIENSKAYKLSKKFVKE